jgi:hypothetical protein
MGHMRQNRRSGIGQTVSSDDSPRSGIMSVILIFVIPLVVGFLIGKYFTFGQMGSDAAYSLQPPFSTVVRPLGIVRIPVYLPTWLPIDSRALRASADVRSDHLNYNVRVYPSTTPEKPLLYLSGTGSQANAPQGKGPQALFDNSTRPVKMDLGVWGFVSHTGLNGRIHKVRWWRGAYLYVVTGRFGDSSLVHIANSFVQVF